jgi:hypothetical protein
MDIRTRLADWIKDFPGAQSANTPVYPLICDALAEIERLEKKLAAARAAYSDLAYGIIKANTWI